MLDPATATHTPLAVDLSYSTNGSTFGPVRTDVNPIYYSYTPSRPYGSLNWGSQMKRNQVHDPANMAYIVDGNSLNLMNGGKRILARHGRINPARRDATGGIAGACFWLPSPRLSWRRCPPDAGDRLPQ